MGISARQGGGGGGGGGTPATETVVFQDDDFTFGDRDSAGNTDPQNITLTSGLSTFSLPATIHFYAVQSDGAGARRSEKEVDLERIRDLPMVTAADFTKTNTENTYVTEVARLQSATRTAQFADSHYYIGKISDTELRIACSHPLVDSGTFKVKVVQY